ncbi:phosphoenolpyruvate carboxykinase (ATP), partial [Gemmatimonadota bacterium]
MDFIAKLEAVLEQHSDVQTNPARKDLIDMAIRNRESVVSAQGALVTWTPAESSGRSPKDTLIVDRDEIRDTIDWDAPNNLPVDVETFEMLWEDALAVLAGKETILITEKVVGAESSYALPVRTITDRANIAIFTENMFRDVPDDIETSIYADKPFTIVELPYDRIDHTKYKGRLRDLPNGEASHMCIIADFEKRLGLVYGSAYCGSCKKLMFTVMNYMLPADGILPIHCSANEGVDGDSALLLGLSGTGKTTLSADAARALLGDDEHGWNDRGIANFEGGCYAKLINLRIDKEPEIWDAAFREADIYEHGALIENCYMNPQGYFDVDDERLTANSRVSYPLSSLKNIKTPPVAGHPKTILFLTA